MTTFDGREKAFEDKFALDEKLDFALEAKTSKIFGLWAAAQLGLGGNDAQTYATDVISANLEEKGFNDIIRKVRQDFDSKGLEITDHTIQTELSKALAEAKKQMGNH